MGQYQVSSKNSQNFTLTANNKEVGDLIYSKWYSFSAEILMKDGKKYQLDPTGFWDAKIELKHDFKTLLNFKMGWKGIIIKSMFDKGEQTFLLKLKGLLSSKFALIDTQNEELMVAETNFKWSKLSFDYNIETAPALDKFENKEVLLLTVVHCINYYLTITSAAS